MLGGERYDRGSVCLCTVAISKMRERCIYRPTLISGGVSGPAPAL